MYFPQDGHDLNWAASVLNTELSGSPIWGRVAATEGDIAVAAVDDLFGIH